MGRRRRARTERMRCCMFLDLVWFFFWCGRLEREMARRRYRAFFELRGLRGKECIFYI